MPHILSDKKPSSTIFLFYHELSNLRIIALFSTNYRECT